MTRPRNCRFCLNCNEYDEGQFYCNPHDKCMKTENHLEWLQEECE